MRYPDRDMSPSAMTASSDRIRRASYYVWFLGAEECRGLRGSDVVKPVVQYLVGREREQEPEKVTLQVSSRGVKLVQQSPNSIKASSVAKHFIPASALTWVQQEESPEDDIVSAVLLIYNPLTRCPVHVHLYRCDSTETAQMLRNHLNQLVERPQQQAKLSALESRLASRGVLPSPNRSSDGASTESSASGSSAGGRGPSGERMAILYDSLAAELREKLGNNKQSPLLLPPRDYDTTLIKRGRGGHDGRKSLEDDSARSSGIGSDDAPSPTHDRDFGPQEHHQSSSDEEWTNYQTTEMTREGDLALVHPNWRSRGTPNPRGRSPSPKRGVKTSSSPSPHHQQRLKQQSKNLSPIRLVHRRTAPPRKGRMNSRDRSESPVSPRERFQDARDKFLSLERDKDWHSPGFESSSRHDSYIRANESFSKSHDYSKSQDSLSRGRESFNRGHHEQVRRNDSSRIYYQDGIDKSPSWDSYKEGKVTRYQKSKKSRDYREDNHERSRVNKRESYSSREDLLWPKSDRDTGYGSRDGLLRDKRIPKDYDRGYGTYDARDSDPWRKDGHRTPDIWERRTPERSLSPSRGRHRTPPREVRTPRHKSPERQEYHRAKSMHDLSHRRIAEDDPRRRSMYDALDDPPSLRDKRKHARHFHSHANLPRPASSCSSNSDSSCSVKSYNELPENQRFPGLDRATARADGPDNAIVRSATALGINKSIKTYDYPVNGGFAPIQITKTHHDDYRRFRYDHQTPQYLRSTSVPAAQY